MMKRRATRSFAEMRANDYAAAKQAYTEACIAFLQRDPDARIQVERALAKLRDAEQATGPVLVDVSPGR